MNIKTKLENPEKYIPMGIYCYVDDKVCPFWESKEGEYPSQEDGYCHYLGKSDWELNEEKEKTSKMIYSNNKEEEGKTIAEINFGVEDIDKISGKKRHFSLSLIWDEVKECCINMEEPDNTKIIEYNSKTKIRKETTLGAIRSRKK